LFAVAEHVGLEKRKTEEIFNFVKEIVRKEG